MPAPPDHVHPRPRGPPARRARRAPLPRGHPDARASVASSWASAAPCSSSARRRSASRSSCARSRPPATSSASTAGGTSPHRAHAGGASAPTWQRGKVLLEELSGAAGPRVPRPDASRSCPARAGRSTCSPMPASRTRRACSPACNPLFGDPSAPDAPVPLAERPGRAAVPGRAGRRHRAPVPRRRVPARPAPAGRRRALSR